MIPTHPVQQKMRTVGTGQKFVLTELVPLSATYDDKSTENPKIAQFAERTIEQSQLIADKPTTTSEPGFAASGRCAQCHTAEMAKWSFTKHSRAWESLLTHSVPGSTNNPDCISVTPQDLARSVDLENLHHPTSESSKAVQCEACHGPLNGHPSDQSVQPLPSPPKHVLAVTMKPTAQTLILIVFTTGYLPK